MKKSEIVIAKGLKCAVRVEGNGLPSFKVLDYTDKDNIDFTYYPGNIIEPDVTNDTYASLLMEIKENEDAKKWQSRYITNYVMYKKICSYDRMSYNTLKELREAFNNELISTIVD